MGCTTGSLDGNVDGGTATECSRVFVSLPAVHLPEPRLSAAGGVGGRGRGRTRTERGIKARRRGVEIPQVVGAGDRFEVEGRDGLLLVIYFLFVLL